MHELKIMCLIKRSGSTKEEVVVTDNKESNPDAGKRDLRCKTKKAKHIWEEIKQGHNIKWKVDILIKIGVFAHIVLNITEGGKAAV